VYRCSVGHTVTSLILLFVKVTSLFDLLNNLFNILVALTTLEVDQCEQPSQSQPYISPNTNTHASVVVGIELVVLVCANTSCNVVEHSGCDNSLRVRKSAVASIGLQSLGCIGAVDRFRCRRQRNGVRKRDKDQGKGNETPAIVAHVVEFEVVCFEQGLRRRSEP
jgi:hypothetical protein